MTITKETRMTKPITLNPDHVRQGDVLFRRVARLPTWAHKEAARDAHGRLVAEYGEASGHAHAIHEPHVTAFRAETAEMAAAAGLDAILVGGSGATMRHEYADGAHAEHAAVALAPGAHVRAVQVDEEAEVLRREAD
ncbi:MAG: hypothetical protein AB7P35_17910 [Hyphomonadaceae bacterium]